MSKKLKFILLLLLSLTSVYFAEVIAGSSKYPLYDFWGIFVVIPLYGLHTIVLLYILKKYLGNRKILFTTLYFAGTLFGLYEAYLTKVLWIGLSPESSIFMNIAWMEFIVLVFFWHPLFAFIIPSLVFEGFMTNDSYLFNGLSEKVKNIIKSKTGLFIIFSIIGIFMALNAIDSINVFMSGVLNAIPILLLYYLLRRLGIHEKYSLDDILPDKNEIKICIGLLIVLYVSLTLTQSVHVLTLNNQIVIWVLYIFLGFIFYRKIKENSKIDEVIYKKEDIEFKLMILYFVVLVLVTSLVSWLWIFGIRDLFMITIWFMWVCIGLIMFVKNLKTESLFCCTHKKIIETKLK